MSEQATTPTPQQLFTNLVNSLGADAVNQLKSVLQSAATSIQNNPTSLNVAAQGVAIQGALIAAVPTLESDAIKQSAATLSQLIASIPEPKLPA